MRILLVSLFILVAFVFCTNRQSEEISIDDKIGQMIMIGFPGTEIHSSSKVIRDIKLFHVGGVILFDYDVPSKSRPRNIESPEQLKLLIENLQNSSATPLFIAVDQEGGRVSRLKTRYGFPSSVSAEHIGIINKSDTSHFWASRTADMLRTANFNMNFAPVVDVNTNPDCPVIGKIERSFSVNPAIVSHEAKIVIDEHKKKKIICALKHFPGHGSATGDSHIGFTDVSETWQPLELNPYKILINNNDCDMIMTAHVFNSQLDGKYPATLSKKTVSNLLRDSLGYSGVVISDDMNMGAIADNYSIEFAIEYAVNAGIDIIMFCNNSTTYDPDMPEKVFTIFKELVESGKISEDRINESYNRIIELKKKYGIIDN